MLFSGQHKELAPSLEKIGAAFAIFEWQTRARSAELVSANRLFEQVTGRPVSECIGSLLSALVPSDIGTKMLGGLAHCFEFQGPQEEELVIEREGRHRWWRMVATSVIHEEHKAPRAIVTLIEITEKKLLEIALELARQRYAAVIKTAYDGVITIDEAHKITLINDSAKSIFGVTSQNVIGSKIDCFIPLKYRDSHHQKVNFFRNSAVASRPMHLRMPVQALRMDGSEFPLEVAISKIRVGGGMEMTAVLRDVSERVKLMDELSRAATHDALTGAFNRRHFSSIVKIEIARCHRFEQPFSVLMFDIDHFKMINDGYGHPVGDKVLIKVTELAQQTLRETDVLFRWGGEEFIAILPATSTQEAFVLAERMRTIFENTPVIVNDESSLNFTASFGVSTYLDKAMTLETLIKQVDKALYRAKASGRNCTAVEGDGTQ